MFAERRGGCICGVRKRGIFEEDEVEEDDKKCRKKINETKKYSSIRQQNKVRQINAADDKL